MSECRDILGLGLDPDLRFHLGGGLRPALCVAVESSGGHVDIVALLLDRGAAVNTWDSVLGMSPVLVAASLGYGEVLSLLLQHRARPEEANVRGETALHLAVRNGHGHAVEALVGREGVDVNAR